MLDTVTGAQTETGSSSVGPARMHGACPICAGAALKHLWQVNGYSIARCQNCSLVFVENIVTPEELNAHYSAWDTSYADDNTDCLTYYYEILRGLIESRYPRRFIGKGFQGGREIQNQGQGSGHARFALRFRHSRRGGQHVRLGSNYRAG